MPRMRPCWLMTVVLFCGRTGQQILAHPQHDPAERVALGETAMSLHRLRQGERRLDQYLQRDLFRDAGELPERAGAALPVVGDDFDAAARARFRFDPVRVDEPAAGPQGCERLLQRIATGEGDRAVDA